MPQELRPHAGLRWHRRWQPPEPFRFVRAEGAELRQTAVLCEEMLTSIRTGETSGIRRPSTVSSVSSTSSSR